MATNDMCACSLSDWMAWACGVRVRATAAELYCASVGFVNMCRMWYSAVLGCCVWHFLFLVVVVVFCFFCGSAFSVLRLRLYMLSCWCCTLSVVVVPHLYQSWSRPSGLFRSRSHLTVCLCSVSSMLTSVGCLLGVPWQCRWSVSLRRSSVSAAAFRSSQTL
jgi:hypothetical protein